MTKKVAFIFLSYYVFGSIMGYEVYYILLMVSEQIKNGVEITKHDYRQLVINTFAPFKNI